MKLENNSFILTPSSNKDLGIYPIELRITDDYSLVQYFYFTMRVSPKRPKSVFV